MQNVLVTGASGFLGSHLLKSMRDLGRYHVIGMVRNPKDVQRLGALGVETRVADLLRPSSLHEITKEVDTVIHLAAKMRFHDPWESLYAHNVEGTRYLALDAMQHQVGYFIYISSTEATGPVDTIPGDESAAYHPTYEYGKSKMMAEQWLHEQTLPVTVLRPTGIYGPGDAYVTLPVLRAVKHGLLRALPAKAADHYIQFTYITDVVQGIIMTLNHREHAVGETFILASDDYYSYRELFTVLAQLLDSPTPRVLNAPVGDARPLAVLRVVEQAERPGRVRLPPVPRR